MSERSRLPEPRSGAARTIDDLERALVRHGIACDDARLKRIGQALPYIDAMVRRIRSLGTDAAAHDGALPARRPDGSWIR